MRPHSARVKVLAVVNALRLVARAAVASLFIVGSVVSSSAQEPPPVFAVKQFNDGTNWIITEAFTYVIGNSNLRITVPKGFVTDFASIPYGVTAFFLPTGKYARAAAVHDYLYWTQACTREQADLIFLLAMTESDVPYGTRRTIHRAVRLKGQSAWDANEMERQAGLRRVIPEAYLQIGPLDVWDAYRTLLRNNGVPPEPTVPKSPSYCSATERDLR